MLEVAGRPVDLIEVGDGPPLLYLHGFADVHGALAGLQPFHQQLGQRLRLIAPAHPGCAGSGGVTDMDTIEDAVFHYTELADSLELSELRLAGACFGGWIAAEPDLKSFSPAAAKSASHDAAHAPNETSATGLLLTVPAPDGPVPESVFHSELRTARSTDPWPRSEVRFQPPLSPLPCLEDEFALAPVVLRGSSPFP